MSLPFDFDQRRIMLCARQILVAVTCGATMTGSVTLPHAARAQSVRDSAGIRIVDNARPAWSANEALHLSATPILEIGKTDSSAYHFSRIRRVARLSDGRILVANGADLQLRFFDAGGRFIRATAGKGTAPGMLSGMDRVVLLRGDSIAVLSGFAAPSLFDNAGAFVRTFESPRADGPRPPRDMAITVLGNGTRVFMPIGNPAPRAPGTRWVESVPMRLIDRDNRPIGDLGLLPFLVFEQEGKSSSPPWLSSIAVFAGTADRLYYGFGEEYAIRVYTADGVLNSIIRRTWTPERVTPERWDYWVVEWAKLWVKSVGEQYQKEMMDLRASAYAEVLPAFSEFIADRAGRLWVREAHLEDAIGAGSLNDPPAVPSKWSVFDANGRWLGDVTMPVNFQPYDIGADYVAGKRYENNVSKAVLYALEPRVR